MTQSSEVGELPGELQRVFLVTRLNVFLTLHFVLNLVTLRSTPFVSKNEVLFVGGPTGVWSLKVETGEVIWFYETGEQCGSSPTVWDGKVGIGCEDGYFYILTTEAC